MMLAAVALPAPALAQAPSAPVPPAPAPVPEPVQTQMTLKLEDVGGTRSTVLAGSRVRVRGTVGAFVPNEIVTVRVAVNGRKVHAESVVIQEGPDGSGAFLLSYRPTRTGRLVSGTCRPAASSSGRRVRSPSSVRRMLATPITAANRMNSSTSVSKPR